MISVLELLVAAFLRGRERGVLELELDVLVLQAAQPLVGIGDVVEGLQHLGLELGLDGGERERVLHVVVVEIASGRALGLPLAVALIGGGRLERSSVSRRRRLRQRQRTRDRHAGHRYDRLAVGADHRARHRLGVGTGIGRFEVDDIPKEDLALVELVPPYDDGLEAERAFAQARDHGLPAGLDALSDGDLAFPREKFHRAHLAQVHADGIIRALDRLLGLGLGRNLLPDLDQLAALALRFLLGFLALAPLLLARLLGLDHVDAHLAEHGENVLDLLGIDLFRQRR